jgi:cytidylate kinase
MPVVTVGGLPGSGKSTFARLLAERLGFEYISAGQVFRKMAEDSGMDLEKFSKYAEGSHEIDRKVDAMQVEMARGKDSVVDSRLSAWVIKDADLRICLVADRPERSRRIAERDGLSEEEALRRVAERERSESLRYKEIYDIDVGNFEVYDLVVNSATFLPEEIVTIARKALGIALERRHGT